MVASSNGSLECVQALLGNDKIDVNITTNTYTYGMNNEYSYNRTETKIEVDESRQIEQDNPINKKGII